MSKKFKLICIDQNKCSIELEVDERVYNLLNIKKENVKKHKSRRSLDLKITEFLDNK